MNFPMLRFVDYDTPFHTGSIIRGSLLSADFASALQSLGGDDIVIDGAILPSGTFAVPDNTRIFFASDASTVSGFCILSVGKNTLIDGMRNQLTRVVIDYQPTAELSCVRSVNFDGTEPGPFTHVGVRFLASQANAPKLCKVEKCTAKGLAALYEHRAGWLSECSRNVSIGCERGFIVYSGDGCAFEKEASIWDSATSLPIVGFLNIATRDLSYSRGLRNNTYSKIQIDGWREEGFAFDGRGNEVNRRAFILNSHVVTASLGGIVIAYPYPGSISNCMVVFHTGALAGKFFEISGVSGPTISLKGFSADWQKVVAGDFIGIELECFGNVVENLNVKSSGDVSGVSVWAWGGFTTIRSTRLENARIEAWSLVNNTGDTVHADKNIYYACHGLTIDDVRPVNEFPLLGSTVDGWHPNDPDRLYSVSICQDTYYWSNKVQDDCIDGAKMLTRGITITGNRSGRNYYRRVADMRIDEIAPDDLFVDHTQYPTLSRLTTYKATPAQVASIVAQAGQTFV